MEKKKERKNAKLKSDYENQFSNLHFHLSPFFSTCERTRRAGKEEEEVVFQTPAIR